MWGTFHIISGLKIASRWLVTTNFPLSKKPPRGVCIHELATMIQKAERDAPSATMDVANRCMPGETLFHPNIMIPMKLASSMKAMAASYPSMCPKKSPPAWENALQFVPNWNSMGKPVATPIATLRKKRRLQYFAWRRYSPFPVRIQRISRKTRKRLRPIVTTGQMM